MGSIHIVYTSIAKNTIKKLHPDLKSGLRMIIDELKLNPYLGKPLQEDFLGFRSHRFKRYRVIYKYHEKQNKIDIIFAGKRMDVYEKFSQYLKQSVKMK